MKLITSQTFLFFILDISVFSSILVLFASFGKTCTIMRHMTYVIFVSRAFRLF